MDELTLPGTLDSLAAIRSYVREAGEKAGLERKAIYSLSLAVDEIATNIVTHGYEEAGLEGDIVIRSSLDHSLLTIQLVDTSNEYDPYGKKDPDNLDKPISERPIGGLGVFLAVRGVDDFHYEYVDGRNYHTFVVNTLPQKTDTTQKER